MSRALVIQRMDAVFANISIVSDCSEQNTLCFLHSMILGALSPTIATIEKPDNEWQLLCRITAMYFEQQDSNPVTL